MFKVIVVEDEAILRNSIVSLMDWKSMGCEVVSECKNGIEAAAYLRSHSVDIVVTDIKMPGMNGIELCRKVREIDANIEIIILSAYTEFHYAKEALKYKVNDFIVKSEFIEELPKALQQVIEKLKQTSIDSIEKESVKLSTDEINRLLTKSILEGKFNDPVKYDEWLTTIGLQLEDYCILLSSFSSLVVKDKVDVMKSYQLTFQGNPIFMQWLDNQELLTIICFPRHETNVLISEKHAWLAHLCRELSTTIQQQLATELCIGISLSLQHAEQLTIGYQQAKTALNQIYLENGIQFYAEVGTEVHLRYDYARFAEQLLLKLSAKNEHALIHYLQDMFASIFSKINDIQKLKLELSMTIAKCAEELKVKTGDNLRLGNIEQQFYTQLAQASSMKIIFLLLNSTLQKMMKLNMEHELQAHHLVTGVRTYIHDHYQQAINLDDIAEVLHFNSSYLSRTYKKETGESVIQYLNRFRIERAKQLIDSHEHKISKVGELVGIVDVSYFSSIFTKIVGASPQKYRKNKEVTDISYEK